MKNLLILVFLCLVGCTPIRYVNVNSRHNYYQKHRTSTYTTPIWIPGYGIVLQTHIIRKHKSNPYVKRGKR